MAELSRRRFLAGASMSAAAAVAAAGSIAASGPIALPGLLRSASVLPDLEAPDLAPLGEDLVVVVRDASSGEIALMSGLQETVIQDQQLVGRLLQAARQLVSRG